MSKSKKTGRRVRTHHKLVVYPDAALTKRARKVTKFDRRLVALINDMFNICRTNSLKGIGLAANQVGVLKRVIVIDHEGLPLAMINPVIDYFSEAKESAVEGCLSHPGKRVEVTRSASIAVRYQDRYGTGWRREESGLLARVIQHEVDHLNGKNIIDYA